MVEEKRISGIACVILCGGKGTRMGGVNKAEISVGDKTLLELQIEKSRSLFARVAVAPGPHNVKKVSGVDILADAAVGSGPIAGLLAGIEWCPEPFLFAVGVDMPRWTPGLVRHMAGQRGEADYVMAEVGDRLQTLLGFYAKRTEGTIRSRCENGQFSLRDLALSAEDGAFAKVPEMSLRATLGDEILDSFDNWNLPSDVRNSDHG